MIWGIPRSKGGKMFRKIFCLVLCIGLIISLIAACSKPTESVTLPPQTVTKIPATKISPSQTFTLIPPTRTSTPVPPTPTATASFTPTRTVTPVEGDKTVSCPGAPDILLKLEEWAQVSEDPPLPNRIRNQPSSSGELIGQVLPGENVLVVDGPHCADGYTWWFVRSLDGLEGWTAEGNAAGYWLIPLQQTNAGWSWQQQTPVTAPPPRKGIGMVYDLHRKVVVAVGGTDWVTVSGETWEFNGVAWSLREDVNLLPERSGAAMAYDSDRQVTVLFGGNGLDNRKFFNDTWEYDGIKWVQQNSSQSPLPRNGAAMAYDPNGHRMLLFGGFGRFSNPAFFDDTWEYKNGEWKKLAPTQHPSAREATQLVYDSARGRLVLFGGGHDAGSVVFNDTWEWNGENWRLRTDLPTSPPARWAYFMAYDKECQLVVLFGGLTGAYDQFNDTWIYDGKTWKQASSDQPPPARWDGGMVYDSFNHHLVLFGGQYWTGEFGFLADTWYLTGGCK
jgi:hypothetical protein